MTVSERNPTPSNRLGLDGLEFVEFTTTQPLVLGALLEKMGFRAVARHRSREVLLYRQGGMNLVVNAHPGVVPAAAGDEPVTAVGAMAFRVANAGEANRRERERQHAECAGLATEADSARRQLEPQRPVARILRDRLAEAGLRLSLLAGVELCLAELAPGLGRPRCEVHCPAGL